MKEFDHDGLLLAEYQGKLFEKSSDLNCSSKIFFRRFLHSNLLEELDLNSPSALSLDIGEGIQSIIEQFGDSNYGKIKYSKSSLFWIGYMYRYISYTRQLSTKFIMEIFKYEQMNKVYYSFHTQDPEWCVKTLLEVNHFDETIFNSNVRLKEIMRKNQNY